jgi:CHAT domain-containing protein
MRMLPLSILLCGVAQLALGGCQSLPPAAVASDLGAPGQDGTAVGNNQVGEACEYRPDTMRDVDLDASHAYGVWCGSWRQPSGHIYEAQQRREGAAQLSEVATASLWRSYLNERDTCEAPASTSILDNVPAVLMQCTEHNGGWPHVAIAATLGGKTYLTDGVPSAVPAIEATLASLAGRPIVDGGGRSAAGRLIDQHFAAEPFGSGDLDRYFGLMRLGDSRNAVDDFAGAEDAFRDALAVQEKILRSSSNPALAMPLMHLALQVSNQARFEEASALFAQAQSLLGSGSDPLVAARLDYYLAMHLLNQDKAAEATTLAGKAERKFAAFVPPGLEEAARRGGPPQSASTGRGASLGSLQPLIVDPQAETAIRALAAVWRLQSIMAYQAGNYSESHKIADAARALLDISGFNPPGTVPRVVRVAALDDAAIGDLSGAERGLRESADLFDQVTPDEKPLAITLLLAGREAQARDNLGEALRQFRAGAKILQDRHLGLPENFITPFLDALFDQAAKHPDDARGLHAEMFEAAQLVQGNLTAQYIAKAAARLAAGEGKVSVALRQLQDTELALKTLFNDRDAEARKPASLQDPKRLAQLDAAIVAAQAKRNDAEAAAQAAAPAYGQLIQAYATTKDVTGLLDPTEGFVAIYLGEKSGFGFLVTRAGVTAYRVPLTLETAAKAVEHLRQTAEAGADDRGRPRIPVFDVAGAFDLYQQLLAPIAGKLDGIDRIVISSDGPLLSLPFEMLVTDKTPAVSNGDYRKVPFLLKRFALSYVPAPQTFVRLRQIKGSQAPEPYVAFGNFEKPTYAQFAATFPRDRCASDLDALQQLADLPGTNDELLEVGRLLDVRNRDIVLGDDFTKAKLERTNLKKFRVVHLATHAFLPSELHCLSEPSILMSAPAKAVNADDAFLYSGEILQLPLDADLVILSACNTAGPSGAAGESLSGLARAFFYAGSRGLLVTQWSVDDDSAQFLTTKTMLGMKPGTVPRDTTLALRQAKLERLETAGRPGGPSLIFSHPFAWAPFVLIGDGLHVTPRTAEQRSPAAAAGG